MTLLYLACSIGLEVMVDAILKRPDIDVNKGVTIFNLQNIFV